MVKFADIFDADGNGVIDREEFVEFNKFMIVGSLLESMELKDKLRDRTESQGVVLDGPTPDELIARVKDNPTSSTSSCHCCPKTSTTTS